MSSSKPSRNFLAGKVSELAASLDAATKSPDVIEHLPGILKDIRHAATTIDKGIDGYDEMARELSEIKEKLATEILKRENLQEDYNTLKKMSSASKDATDRILEALDSRPSKQRKTLAASTAGRSQLTARTDESDDDIEMEEAATTISDILTQVKNLISFPVDVPSRNMGYWDDQMRSFIQSEAGGESFDKVKRSIDRVAMGPPPSRSGQETVHHACFFGALSNQASTGHNGVKSKCPYCKNTATRCCGEVWFSGKTEEPYERKGNGNLNHQSYNAQKQPTTDDEGFR